MNMVDLVREQFAWCETSFGRRFFQGRKLAYFAVADDLDAGRAYVEFLPGQYTARGEPVKGRHAFLPEPLPRFVTFVYPEHDLTPKEQTEWLDELYKRHPEAQEIVVVTTSAVMLTDVMHDVVRVLRTDRPSGWRGRVQGGR